ncbi:hypothetical protein BS47DRAFT_1488788 [Hydnum rufescens UP504]|uniref:HNH nuclease domain-containing protein n=1 Tax=Hydnum rufescens UP504 TaxID=1448309 RepID=A0A9P6AKQ3_9AGAM|nr:hypothetical protein BS47DRAFT_1488788 [Hydnum rufescens UP504]
MSLEHWSPFAFNLRDGLPFSYSESAISEIAGTESAVSEISATEAFVTKIDQRDSCGCIVCGNNLPGTIDYARIIPKVEKNTWEDMRTRQFIPAAARSVKDEARNGILLCKTHHAAFDVFHFYVRWGRCFVLVNQCGRPSLQPFHGRAVRLFPHSRYLQFHAAFLIHEMRTWIQDAPDGRQPPGDDDDAGDSKGDGKPDMGSLEAKGTRKHFQTNVIPALTSHTGSTPMEMMETLSANTDPRQTITLTNPFANPADLEALKRSFAEQPNFKAAAESWGGTAEENIKKWHSHGRGNFK